MAPSPLHQQILLAGFALLLLGNSLWLTFFIRFILVVSIISMIGKAILCWNSAPPSPRKDAARSKKMEKDNEITQVHLDDDKKDEGSKKHKVELNKSVIKADNQKHGTKSLKYPVSTGKAIKGHKRDQMKLDLRHAASGESKALSKYDETKCRRALANYVGRRVETERSTYYSLEFKIPTRKTVGSDICQLYEREKVKMKSFLKENAQRICITTHASTSIHHVNYMSLTAHFIDNDWKLQKKILCFRPIVSHKGIDIGTCLERWIKEWGIQKIFSITVDNASPNDSAVSYLRTKMGRWKTSILGGEYLHVRCVAHVINLVVQAGLKGKYEDKAIGRIRGVVRYIRSSTARYQAFCRCVDSAGIKSKKMLRLDVPTRWNSTFLMLDEAINLEIAFISYEETDDNIREELVKSGSGMPDWQKAKTLHKFLQYFYEFTKAVSGSLYVTSNIVFHKLRRVEEILNDALCGPDMELAQMARRMKDKYDKYFGPYDKINKIFYYAIVLDPRFKVGSLEDVFSELHKDYILRCEELKAAVRKGMTSLFNKYQEIYDGGDSKELSQTTGGQVKSELEIYLTEDVICPTMEENFDILDWWSKNCSRFPILSKVARDVLSVPVSTIASKSAFSTGGRVVSDFRSKLLPETVEALICTKDWLCGPDFEMSLGYDEAFDEAHDLEKGGIQLPSSDEYMNYQGWRLAVETHNILGRNTLVPEEYVSHVRQYMLCGQYAVDCKCVADKAVQFAESVEFVGDGKDVWVFDIDETLLSNVAYYRRRDVRYGSIKPNLKKFFDEWVVKAEAVAVPEMLRLYNRILALGFKAVILTGSPERYREIRTNNLRKAGFDNWEKIIFKGKKYKGITSAFKSEQRANLVKEGYRIVGNVSDQWSDLSGDDVGMRTFKVPNPLHFS